MISCKEEHIINHTTEKGEVVNEFAPCECSVFNEVEVDKDYIKAEINGSYLCFDIEPNFSSNFANMLKYGNTTNNTYYDNLYMIRNTANGIWQIAIFLENTHALTKTYPYNLPRENPEFCEIGEIQLNKLGYYISCSYCPENKYNYIAPFFGSGMKLTATSFQNNVFKGVFSGIVKTGNGKSAVIKNGEFRIRLKLENTDINNSPQL